MIRILFSVLLGLWLVGIVPMPMQSQCYYDTVQKRMICCDRYGLCT